MKRLIAAAKASGRVLWYLACALVVVVVFRACYRTGEVINMVN